MHRRVKPEIRYRELRKSGCIALSDAEWGCPDIMIFGHNSDEYKALINTHSRAHRHSPGIGDSSSPCCFWVIHHWNFLLQSIKWEARPGEWCHSFEPTVKSGHHPLHEMQDTRTVHARNLQLGSECTDLLSSVLFYGTAYETWLWRLKSVTFIRQKRMLYNTFSLGVTE